MRVLIVEDNAFNAYCLRRLLESVIRPIEVTIANNSAMTLARIHHDVPDLVILDGDLGAKEGYHNGPSLAHLLLQKYPDLPLVAWSDSENMREAFITVFKQHLKPLNEYNTWTKVVSTERIIKTWDHFFGDYISEQNATPYQAKLHCC